MPHTRVHSGMMPLAVVDFACLVLGSYLGYLLRMGPDFPAYGPGRFEGLILLIAGVMLGNYLGGAYHIQHRYSRFNMLAVWGFSLALGILFVSLVSYTWFTHALGRGILALSLAVYSLLSLTFRFALYPRYCERPRMKCRTVILGDGLHFERLRGVIENEHILPRHRVVAMLNTAESGQSVMAASGNGHAGWRDAPRTTPENVAVMVRECGATVLVADFTRRKVADTYLLALRQLRFEGLEVLTPLAAMERYAGRIPLDMINLAPELPEQVGAGLVLYSRTKRLGDVLFCLAFGLLSAPVMIGIALLLKLTEPRLPIFYFQERVGRFGTLFRIVKFRSMRPDAESASGAVWASAGDRRVTWLGRWLRRFRCDELPQLFNVLRGDMSLVGPRPERPELAEIIQDRIPFFSERVNVLPGLTGWAQIRYPYGESIEDAARKLEYDLYYIKNMSLVLDLQIVLSTIRIVVLGKERVV